MRSHFISDYLTHWTGKDKSEDKGFENIKSILSNCRLWLNHCPHFQQKWSTAYLRMVSFTDIPHHLTNEHCQRYGKFGIAFKKSALIKYGANPVLYLTDRNKVDAEEVYNYICDASTGRITLDSKVLKGLKELFGLVQDYEYQTNEYYYEREWRILQDNIECDEGATNLAGKCGYFMRNAEKQYYFQFSQDDIEFLICPKNYANMLAEVTDKYSALIYEYLVL